MSVFPTTGYMQFQRRKTRHRIYQQEMIKGEGFRCLFAESNPGCQYRIESTPLAISLGFSEAILFEHRNEFGIDRSGMERTLTSVEAQQEAGLM